MPTVARLNQYGSLQAIEFDEVNSTNSVKVNASGTFFSTEFDENIDINFNFSHTYNAYDITNDLIAEPFFYDSGEKAASNIYSPYDIISGEFAIPEYGPGLGTYMSYLVNHRCLVYNEIDDFTDLYDRSIVKDGLILDLDAEINDSYPGSGTTWTDLSGNGNNGSLVGSTTFNSEGYFVLDGVSGNRLSASVTYPTTWSQPVSFELWAYFDADGTWHNTFYGGLFSRGSTIGTFGLTRANGNNSVRMWLRDDGGTATAAGTIVRDAWYHIVGTWGGSANITLKLYLNGVETGSFTKSTLTGSPDVGGYAIGGMTSTLSGSPGNHMKGRISIARMYNKELTAAEVQQNFNALRYRFNL